MITWQLWRAIHLPPYGHPLFDRISNERSVIAQNTLWWGMGILIIGVMILMPEFFVPLLLISPVFYTLFNATLNGVSWAFNVSGSIARVRMQNAYDVLCLIPDGALAVNWVIYTGRLYHEQALAKSRADMVGSLQLLSLIGIGLLLGTMIMPTRDMLESLAVMISLMVLIFVDYAQSVVTCGLTAILVANLTRSLGDARLWSVGLYLFIQVVLYLILILMVLILLPAVHARLDDSMWLPVVLTPPLIVLTFIALRELVLSVLWSRVAEILNADNNTIKHLDKMERLFL